MEKILKMLFNLSGWFYRLKWIDKLNNPTYGEHRVYDSYGIIDTLGHNEYNGRWTYSYSDEIRNYSTHKILPGLWITADEDGYYTNWNGTGRKMRLNWRKLAHKLKYKVNMHLYHILPKNGKLGQLLLKRYAHHKVQYHNLGG